MKNGESKLAIKMSKRQRSPTEGEGKRRGKKSLAGERKEAQEERLCRKY